MRSGSATPEPHRLIHCGFRIGDELVQIGVVGFLGITDDGECSVVDDGVAREQQQSVLPQLGERLLRACNLAGCRSIGVVERIGIKNRGDARAFLIAGRRVERERQVQTVRALVLDQPLLDRAHLGRGIGNVGDRDARGSESSLLQRSASSGLPSVRVNALGGSAGD